MFQGLHQRLQKPDKPKAAAPKHPSLTPIQAANVLLATEKRQLHLKNIKSLLNLPPKLYENLYQKVVDRFAEFVQALPQTQYGAFSNVGGFLDHGIERASRALTLCLNYFYPQEKTFQSVTSQEALWLYAVFTAGLFLDLGKLPVKYRITLCNKDGSSIKEWLPYAGSMLDKSACYKYDFVKENRDNLGRLVTSLLARQILDEAVGDKKDDGSAGGFNWLASNPDVLEAWLSMLNSEGRPMGSFMTIIPLADAQVIEGFFAGLKIPAGQNNTRPFGGSMFDAAGAVAAGEGLLTAIGSVDGAEAFLRWFRDGLQNGTISVNDLAAHVQVVREGVLMSTELFNVFAASSPQYKNAGLVESQFNKMFELYVEPISDFQRRYSHLGGGVFNQAQNRWLLINNAHLLFAMGQVPTINPDINIVKRASTQSAAKLPERRTPGVANNQPTNRNN